MRMPLAIAFALAASLPAAAQVDQSKIDEAIKNGAQFLMQKYPGGFDESAWNSPLEIAMLTLSHANVKPDEPVFAKGLESLLNCKLQYTYRVAFLAMALNRIDAVKYQERIAYCAQWLVDSQLPAGEWGYPDMLELGQTPKPFECKPPKIDKKADPKSGNTVGTIKIKRDPNPSLNLKARGDISNAQMAILGLKACQDSGVEIPKETWQRALGYMLKAQNKDGGWGYWVEGMMDANSYGSMTCAGVCSVAICNYGLGNKNAAKVQPVLAGLNWLGKTFRVDENPGAAKDEMIVDPTRWPYYYVYSLERVGKILGIEKIGTHKWYDEGAKHLIEKQKSNGSWWTGLEGRWREAGDIETADTCFAILFLTKSTPPLVPTGDSRK